MKKVIKINYQRKLVHLSFLRNLMMASLILFIGFVPFKVKAQEATMVTGKITDSNTGEALIGVAIVVENTSSEQFLMCQGIILLMYLNPEH